MDEFDQPLCVLLFEHSNSKFDNMKKPISLMHFSNLNFDFAKIAESLWQIRYVCRFGVFELQYSWPRVVKFWSYSSCYARRVSRCKWSACFDLRRRHASVWQLSRRNWNSLSTSMCNKINICGKVDRLEHVFSWSERLSEESNVQYLSEVHLAFGFAAVFSDPRIIRRMFVQVLFSAWQVWFRET